MKIEINKHLTVCTVKCKICGGYSCFCLRLILKENCFFFFAETIQSLESLEIIQRNSLSALRTLPELSNKNSCTYTNLATQVITTQL